MSLLPLLLKTSDPNTVLTSHLDNYKEALSNLVSGIEQDGILLSIDVKNFEPSEVTVATIGNTIIVEGKHEDKVDTRNSRHFVRKYILPTTISTDDITTFSSDGLFTIYVPPKLKSAKVSSKTESTAVERVVPIKQTIEVIKSEPKVYEPTERVIPIQLTEEIIKSPTKIVACTSVNPAVPKKHTNKILRFANIHDSEEDIKEQNPEQRLIRRKLFCCCQ